MDSVWHKVGTAIARRAASSVGTQRSCGPVSLVCAHLWGRWIAVQAAVAVSVVTALLGSPSRAHEVDQFTVPAGEEFADLGDYWNQMLCDAVHKGVEKANGKIRQAEQIPIPQLRQMRLAQLHSPEAVAGEVRRQLPSAIWAIEGLELKLRQGKERARHPNKILCYRAPLLGNIFSYLPLIPDPRQLNRILFLRCSTIKIHGTYLGTDKVSHFVSMGYLYYGQYRKAIRTGKTREEALRRAKRMGETGPLSERGLVGYVPTAVYSNADMVANYTGMKFYISLTDPVRLKGRWCDPMLVRDGRLWKIQPHVRPEGTFLAMFISDHLDEALNPSLYDITMRSPVRAAIKRRSKTLLDWYAGDDPVKRRRAYFDQLLAQYATYYGQDYGHYGRVDDLITIGNTCFEQVPPGTTERLKLVEHLRYDEITR